MPGSRQDDGNRLLGVKTYLVYVGRDDYRTCIAVFTNKPDTIEYMSSQNCDDVEIHTADDPTSMAEYHLNLAMLREM